MKRIHNKNEYFKLVHSFESIPFYQTEPWFEYQIINGEKISLFMNDNNNPIIAFFGKEIKVPFFGNLLFVHSPLVKKDTPSKFIQEEFSNLLKLDYQGIEIVSDVPYEVSFEIGMRSAGFKKPSFQTASALTIIIDLQNEVNYNRLWRRNIKKATESGIKFEFISNPKIEDAITFCKIFSEISIYKNLGYDIKYESIIPLMKSESYKTFCVKKEEEIIASRIIYIHNEKAFDVFAANSIISRSYGATFLLMHNIFEFLKNRKIKLFDFSRIPIGKKGAEGVCSFKQGTRGEVIQYNGEWVYYKNKHFERIINLYKKYILKKESY